MTKRGNKKSFHITTVPERRSIARTSRNDESSERGRNESRERGCDIEPSRRIEFEIIATFQWF